MESKENVELDERLEREKRYMRSAGVFTLFIILPLLFLAMLLVQMRPRPVTSFRQVRISRNFQHFTFTCIYKGRSGSFEVFEFDGQLLGMDPDSELDSRLPKPGNRCRVSGRIVRLERQAFMEDKRIRYRIANASIQQ